MDEKNQWLKKEWLAKKMTNPVRCILLLIIFIDLALYFEDPVR